MHKYSLKLNSLITRWFWRSTASLPWKSSPHWPTWCTLSRSQGAAMGLWWTDGNFAPAEDRTARGPLGSQECSAVVVPPLPGGTNVTQAKFADIFWRGLGWWANQSLFPSALRLSMWWKWLQQQQRRKDRHPGYKFLWRTGQFADNNGIRANFKQIPNFKCFEINLNVWKVFSI